MVFRTAVNSNAKWGSGCMKGFHKVYAVVLLVLLLVFSGTNIFLFLSVRGTDGRIYRVEVNRIAKEIERKGLEGLDLSEYGYVTNVVQDDGGSQAFYEGTDSDYTIRVINGRLYRFDYRDFAFSGQRDKIILANSIFGIMSLLVLAVMAYIQQKILKPFERLCDVPYELSKGNLIIPIKEQKNHFFGRFLWGIDLLRENMELQKQRELKLQREKKTLVLSVSHDIKTPLSAIKLYAKAISKGLYVDKKKQTEIAERIDEKADEIEGVVSEIIKASSEDFLDLEVIKSEFYLSELINEIAVYYGEKMGFLKTGFFIGKYSDCILKGDIDRSVEVVQNIMENAIKYGDGHTIEIIFSEEEDCQLVMVKNSGCTLPESELPHIFESFWRGSNAGSNKGSGLGLHICRQLIHKMDGEIFADIQGNSMCVTTVFRKAV